MAALFIHIYKVKTQKSTTEQKFQKIKKFGERVIASLFLFSYSQLFERKNKTKMWRNKGEKKEHQDFCFFLFFCCFCFVMCDDSTVDSFVLCLLLSYATAHLIIDWRHSCLRFGARGTARDEIVFQLAQSRLNN